MGHLESNRKREEPNVGRVQAVKQFGLLLEQLERRGSAARVAVFTLDGERLRLDREGAVVVSGADA